MTDFLVDVQTDDEQWSEVAKDTILWVQQAKDALYATLCGREELPLMQEDKPLALCVCLSYDAKVRELNRDFRGLDKPTNVLSFANIDFADFATENQMFAEIDLGNVIIALETLQREAAEQGITFKAHFMHLLVHGMLHILGYDHIEQQDAEQMENLEVEILANLGIDNPYEKD